ncbi:MAG: HU family DNA-binding protein [Myxococcota bacterium]|nr:HU family DNA-binding protein [Myxococcota bacterium]
MNKSDLIERVAESTQHRKRDVEEAVNLIFRSMKEALVNEERIEIRGLGSFHVKLREARVGRNPKSGTQVDIPNRKIPFFKAGRELRTRLNQ